MFNLNSLPVLFIVIVVVLTIFCQATRDFSSTEQRKLLRFVNRFRKNVANCEYPAANMQEILWDDKLVELAQNDVAKCKIVSSHGSEISGVAIFLTNYSRVEDLIRYVRYDPVTRPYLVKATFISMGCAMNLTSCPEKHEIVCYWYPLCGTLYNAFEEGPLACAEYGSKNSKNYKGLCMLPRDDSTDIGNQIKSEVCSHKSRRKPSQENDDKPKEVVQKKDTLTKFIWIF